MSSLTVCVDASLVVRLFVGPDDADVWRLWDEWATAEVAVHAPALLGYEVTNALHRYHRAGFLSSDSADLVLDAALSLPIRYEHSPVLLRHALRLADRLGLSAAYDAQYLAVAEHLDAELWTADKRLVRQAASGPVTVRLVGQVEP
jgi:predicted nucleic acid-binding protein